MSNRKQKSYKQKMITSKRFRTSTVSSINKVSCYSIYGHTLTLIALKPDKDSAPNQSFFKAVNL